MTEIIDGDLLLVSVGVKSVSGLGREIQQAPDGFPCLPARTCLKPLAQQDQGCNHRSGLKVEFDFFAVPERSRKQRRK